MAMVMAEMLSTKSWGEGGLRERETRGGKEGRKEMKKSRDWQMHDKEMAEMLSTEGRGWVVQTKWWGRKEWDGWIQIIILLLGQKSQE